MIFNRKQAMFVATTATVLSMGVCPAALSFSFDLPSGFDTDRSEQFDTSLYFYSETGDFVGQGEEVFFGPTEGDFAISDNFDNGVTFSFNNRAVVGFFDSVFWQGNFAAPFEVPLEVGTYDNATRFPFQSASRPGLSFTGDGRGCNRSGGRFDVLDIQYDNGGSVNRFDAVFAQYCENESASGTPALFGRVRFNAATAPAGTSPPAVPEHPGTALAVVALGGLGLGWKRRLERIQGKA